MGTSPPDDSSGNVSVRLEGCERQERFPNVPHVDCKVDDQRRAADMLATLRSPFHLLYNNTIMLIGIREINIKISYANNVY